jgi:hypothetical protein
VQIPETWLLKYSFQSEVNVGVWSLSFARHGGRSRSYATNVGQAAYYCLDGVRQADLNDVKVLIIDGRERLQSCAVSL